jgi:hypothetical protein
VVGLSFSLLSLYRHPLWPLEPTYSKSLHDSDIEQAIVEGVVGCFAAVEVHDTLIYICHRTTAQAFKPVTSPTRSFSGCRRTILEPPSVLVLRHHSFPSVSLARISKPCYSTVPGQANEKTKADVPLSSKSTPSRKPKVDLRPAPKKPGQEPRNGKHPPRPPAPAVQETATSSSSTSAPIYVSTPSTLPSPGPLEATKHDIAEATKHGILAPPPEDASRVGRVWHQLKQLFWFYWGGLKLIFVTHRRQASAIRRRAAEARAKGEVAVLSRWETRFLRTYDKDLVKYMTRPFHLLVTDLAFASQGWYRLS